MPRRDAIGDRPAGILHQFDAWNAARNRQAVGFGHFGGCEEFHLDVSRETKQERGLPFSRAPGGDHRKLIKICASCLNSSRTQIKGRGQKADHA